MNPTVKRLHDEMQSLINEAKSIQAKESKDSRDVERAEAIPGEIAAIQQQIANEQNLSKAIAEADTFLNGMGKMQSIASSAIVDKDESFKAIANSRHTARHLMSVGMASEDAKKLGYRMGMFVRAAMGKADGLRFCRDNGIPLAGHTEGINEEGGFLVLPEFEQALILLREKYGVFRSNARYTPMGSETHSRLRQTQGLTAYFVDEEDSITESKMKWDRVTLTAKKVAILAKYSGELGQDGVINLGDTFAGEAAYAFAKKEDECGFIGDGTSTYGRMVGVTQRLYDVFTTAGGTGLVLGAGNAYSELTIANFYSVAAALPLYAEANAKWYCSKAFFEGVMKPLALAAGGVPAAEIINGVARRFLGFDVELAQSMPTTAANSQVPVVFGDLGLAAEFGDRMQTSIAASEHIEFNKDITQVRAIQRFDINVHDVGATGTAGPVVGLIMAAS